ncbi:MAG: hypothetical protein JW839_21985 [Candidatus Lokiarchaeota archaeon]|nr:hypothetical protein [Candidatus Lokiarchaeota archaeon]
MLRRIISRSQHGESICLVDKGFNELLDVHDDNFSELFHVLSDIVKVSIAINREDFIPEDLLSEADIFVIGCPARARLSADDIETIAKYVREGGNLLVITDAGGDLAHQTNLNDLVAEFGIEIEYTTVRDTRNVGSAVSPVIENINVSHSVNKNVMRLVVGGGTTLSVVWPAVPLFSTGRNSVVEQLGLSANDSHPWKIVKVGENYPMGAATLHGQGKVVVIGDVDMFSNDGEYGITALDNGTFIKNVFAWFLAPVETSTVIDWLIARLSNLEEKYNAVSKKCDNISAENEKLKKILKEMHATQGKYAVVDNDTSEGAE